jgi:hypothetical protein
MSYEEVLNLSDKEFFAQMDDYGNRANEMIRVLREIVHIRQEFYKNPELILPIGILQYIE